MGAIAPHGEAGLESLVLITIDEAPVFKYPQQVRVEHGRSQLAYRVDVKRLVKSLVPPVGYLLHLLAFLVELGEAAMRGSCGRCDETSFPGCAGASDKPPTPWGKLSLRPCHQETS